MRRAFKSRFADLYYYSLLNNLSRRVTVLIYCVYDWLIFQSSRGWLSFQWKSLLSKRNSASERTVNRAVINETILTRETFQDTIDELGFTRDDIHQKVRPNLIVWTCNLNTFLRLCQIVFWYCEARIAYIFEPNSLSLEFRKISKFSILFWKLSLLRALQ